ncbi:hypothetical protein H5410_044654 [Solanum commersonii]|uniref:Uncharacterized protein n=1 Tax=Solanum commersonii TaxID=4109 RepID=A0A9J5XAI4_SOLCO|nr:hypothetical protein H5410_044654 [Solanum commersonii]
MLNLVANFAKLLAHHGDNYNASINEHSCLKELNVSLEVEKWLSDENFEERVKGRGIRKILFWAHNSMVDLTTFDLVSFINWRILNALGMKLDFRRSCMWYTDDYFSYIRIRIRVELEGENRVLVMKD